MLRLAQRNMRIFFRQKSAVFFSLLSVFIVIMLYVLFLGDVWTNSMDLPGAKSLMASWIVAGLVCVSTVTTTMGTFETMIEDASDGQAGDFRASPVRRSSIVGGYIISAVVVGFVMSLVALALGCIYIVSTGGLLPGFADMTKFVGITALAAASNSAMVFFLVCLFKSKSAFAAVSTIIGTLIGFLTGIYLPIGELPAAVQTVIKCFPPSHAAALMRQILVEPNLSFSLEGAPAAAAAEVREWFGAHMGVTYTLGGTEIAPWMSVLIIAASGVVFFTIGVAVFRKKREV